MFDTTPDAQDDAGAAAVTTLPIIDVGTRLPLPQLRVLDDELVYLLDPALVATEEPEQNIGAGPTVADDADPAVVPPTLDTTTTVDPGPLTQVQIFMTPEANVREIDDVRTTMSDYVETGAAVAELTGAELGGALAAVYDDDPRFAAAARRRPLGTILLLAHRWPEESGLRTEVIRAVRRLAGVDQVVSTTSDRIHRTSIRIGATEEIVVEVDSAGPDRTGVAIIEGQRLAIFDDSGRPLASTTVGRDIGEFARLVLTAGETGRAKVDADRTPDPVAGANCTRADRSGLLEARICTYPDGSSGIELQANGRTWKPLVGAPTIPRRWQDDPPPGAESSDAGWSDVFISPDHAWVLAQWGGTCLTRSAALLDVENPQITFIESRSSLPWGPGTTALGWAPDGRAIVYLGAEACETAPSTSGLYLLTVGGEDDGDLELMHRRGAGPTDVAAVVWRMAG